MDGNRDVAHLGGYLIVGVVLIAWAYVALVPPPALPPATANGLYFNPCCGLIRLSNGLAVSGAGSFKYVIRSDKEGPYVLPTDHDVYATPQGIRVAPGEGSFKIRLAGASPRQSIDIIGRNAEYKFIQREG